MHHAAGVFLSAVLAATLLGTASAGAADEPVATAPIPPPLPAEPPSPDTPMMIPATPPPRPDSSMPQTDAPVSAAGTSQTKHKTAATGAKAETRAKAGDRGACAAVKGSVPHHATTRKSPSPETDPGKSRCGENRRRESCRCGRSRSRRERDGAAPSGRIWAQGIPGCEAGAASGLTHASGLGDTASRWQRGRTRYYAEYPDYAEYPHHRCSTDRPIRRLGTADPGPGITPARRTRIGGAAVRWCPGRRAAPEDCPARRALAPGYAIDSIPLVRRREAGRTLED